MRFAENSVTVLSCQNNGLSYFSSRVTVISYLRFLQRRIV